MFFDFLKINYYEVKKFFKEKQDCKVYFFNIPTTILFSFLDYDIIQTVNHRIEVLRNYDKCSLDEIKKSIKLSWLIKELRNKDLKNPVQLLKKGKKYFCHPGTDRVLTSLYIFPKKFIKGFYIWYPNLDENPFIFDYEFYEVKNHINFLTKFKYSKSFKFKSINLNNDLDVSDKDVNSNAIFSTAKNCFIETDKTFNSLFLTYRDKMQYDKIKNLKINDAIEFIDDNICNYGGVLFEKKKNIWVVKRD